MGLLAIRTYALVGDSIGPNSTLAHLLAAPRVWDAVHHYHPPWHVPRCEVGTDDRFDFSLQLPRKSVPAALDILTNKRIAK